MNLAHGELKSFLSTAEAKVYLVETEILFRARTETTVTFMQFINKGTIDSGILLIVDFDRASVLLRPRNYKLKPEDDPLYVSQEIFLKPNNTIRAAAEKSGTIDFIIDGIETGEIVVDENSIANEELPEIEF